MVMLAPDACAPRLERLNPQRPTVVVFNRTRLRMSCFVTTRPGRDITMAITIKRVRVLLSTAFLACVAISGCSEGAESELEVSSAPIIQGCSKNADCEDGNPCTQNLCAVGACT